MLRPNEMLPPKQNDGVDLNRVAACLPPDLESRVQSQLPIFLAHKLS